MSDTIRATFGGVGAVIVGLAVSAAALAGGWIAGSAYGGRFDSPGCAGACSSSAAAAEVRPTTPTAVPIATPTEPADLPYVSANSIAIIESACGAKLFGRNEHDQFAPASLTKLMTAAVAAEQAEMDDMFTSNVDAATLHEETLSTVMGLRPGMELSLRDLMYGLMLPSGNDAAITIAEGISGSEEAFAELMNAKARSLALDDSNFTNPHGLDDPDLYSSAYDMGMLARYLMQDEEMRTIVRAVSWQPKWDGPPVWNGNRLLQEYPGADGIKIGYTEESQQTIVGSAADESGRRIIVSLMRSQDRYTDASRLFDWAFAQPSACP